MTTSYRCDRCGAEATALYGDHGKPAGWSELTRDTQTSNLGEVPSHDLCARCTATAVEWIQARTAKEPTR